MIVYHFLGIFDITLSLFGAVVVDQNKAIFDLKYIISVFEEFFEKYAISSTICILLPLCPRMI
jgi:hypothetical protein